MSRLAALAPEIALFVTAGVLFAMMPGRNRRAPAIVLAVGGSVALAAALAGAGSSDEFLYLAYRVDPFSQIAKSAVLAGLLIAGIAGSAPSAEEAFFLAVATLGLVAATSLVDALALFLALEIISVAMMALAGFGCLADGNRGWGRLVRASITPSALCALGLALLVGSTGATRLNDISSALAADAARPAAILGGSLFLGGVLVRWGAAPFYAWLPHLARDASPRVALFAGTSLWAGLGAIVVRLAVSLAPLGHVLGVLLSLIAAAAIGFGTLKLRPVGDARCAVSCVLAAQAGLVLTSLVSPGAGAASALGAIAVAAAASAATLLVIGGVGRAERGASFARIGALVGRAPAVALPLVTGLLALAAVPPAAGFMTRWRLLGAAWQEGWWVPALVGLGASVMVALAVFVALREFFRGSGGSDGRPPAPADRTAMAVAWALAILLVVLGLAPAPLLRGAEALARYLA